MLHSIENQKYICKIESVGAEIRSLKCKSTGKEYIWQINPSIWGNSSPVLFPSIGNIKGNKLIYKGIAYAMTKHGIVRNNENLSFLQQTHNACSFSLKSSDETKKRYPFEFEFSVNYQLIDHKLLMTYKIQNRDKDVMFFSFGGHTAYVLPLENNVLSDYFIEFPNQTSLTAKTLGGSGLISDKIRKFSLNEHMLQLNETIFNQDALILANIDFDWVRLRKRGEEKGVIIRFKGFPNLALWSKPKANYICIEPWLGLPDGENESLELTEKKTYQKLESGASFEISIETEIES